MPFLHHGCLGQYSGGKRSCAGRNPIGHHPGDKKQLLVGEQICMAHFNIAVNALAVETC